MNRRNFFKNSALTTLGVTGIHKLPALPPNVNEKLGRIRIGICADLHQDVMHDGPKRIEAFIRDMEVQKPDFIIQMGDFCRPYDYNRVILDIFNRFNGPRYHVIGNHDMDGGFTRDQVVAFWKAIGKYYSFDQKGYHFIVLDGNDHDPSPDRPSGYARFIGKEQMQWLEEDLEKTRLPVIIFLHQGLDNDLGGIYNAMETRLVLERANKRAGFRKVQLVFTGHHHQDYHNVINGIHYIQINSMSYQWLGGDYEHLRYSEEVDKTHPYIKATVPYKDPLWAVVDIFPNGDFRLKGTKSVFVGPSPEDLGMSPYQFGYPIVPYISDRKISLTKNSFEYIDTNGVMAQGGRIDKENVNLLQTT